jgi:hypothetical protein
MVEILHHRMIERRREEIADEIRTADEEFRSGLCDPRSLQDLMKEIQAAPNVAPVFANNR